MKTMDLIREFQTILSKDKIYKPDEIVEMISDVRKNFRFAWSNKKLKYYNVPCAFDIETSSFYDDDVKCAVMYEWTLGVYGAVMIGRTYNEFITVIKKISEILDLNTNKRLIIYIHNLAYEFQFIRKHFEWEKVFAIDTRKPLYALSTDGVEFRCSYLLSGYSLEKLGEQLHDCTITKLTGYLDYTLNRHSKTILTQKEIAYCVNDVKIVMAYIMERIKQDGGLSRLPLTKTGYVRKYCRNACFYGADKKDKNKRLRYREFIQSMKIEPDEYKQMKRAFQGGFTHANPFYSGKIVTDVTSYDFTSSYPAVMIAERFPMSSGEIVYIETKEQAEHFMKYYCCVFDVEFTGITATAINDNYISSSKCWLSDKAILNNGRVVAADLLRMSLTEQDYFIIKKMYVWDRIRFSNFRIYRKDYLPKDFVISILNLYKDKTELKGVEGKDVEYLRSKEMLNSCYGMTVTDIVRPVYEYTDDWEDAIIPDLGNSLEKYNKAPGRFLFYLWGVYVTAYARRNLFTGILSIGDDYIYSDTDSIKMINAENHLSYIHDYNQKIAQQIQKALDYHNLPPDVAEPMTVKGVKKPLGVWDFDGFYSRFKTLGAKRYMTESNGAISITVAGLNKKITVPYLLEKYGDSIFDAFSDQLYIPPEYTGKNIHTYIDKPRDGILIDYRGVSAEYHEKSCIHLEQSDYTLSISREYADFLKGVKENEI